MNRISTLLLISFFFISSFGFSQALDFYPNQIIVMLFPNEDVNLFVNDFNKIFPGSNIFVNSIISEDLNVFLLEFDDVDSKHPCLPLLFRLCKFLNLIGGCLYVFYRKIKVYHLKRKPKKSPTTLPLKWARCPV